MEQVLFPCVMRRLAAQDQDQEVKEAAIACMATLLASLGDVLAREVPGALKVTRAACSHCRFGLCLSLPAVQPRPCAGLRQAGCLSAVAPWTCISACPSMQCSIPGGLKGRMWLQPARPVQPPCAAHSRRVSC